MATKGPLKDEDEELDFETMIFGERSATPSKEPTKVSISEKPQRAMTPLADVLKKGGSFEKYSELEKLEELDELKKKGKRIQKPSPKRRPDLH